MYSFVLGIFLIQLWTFVACNILNVHISPAAVLQLAKTSVMLKCETSASDDVQITWEINEREIPLMPASGSTADEEVYVLANNSLYIKKLRRRNTGEYTCLAIKGTEKRFAKVKVEIAYLQGIESIEPLEVFDNSDAKINCNKPLGKPLPSVTWKFNGVPITASARYDLDWTLVIKKPLSKSDEGNYTCIAMNQYKVREKSTYLAIRGYGNLTVTQKSLKLLEKESSEVKCMSNADPPLVVTWQHLDNSTGKVLYKKIPSSGSVTTKDGKLIIANATYTDSGTYECSAIMGSQLQAEIIQVNIVELVKVEERFQRNKQNRNIRTQLNTTINCYFRGDGTISYKWVKIGSTELPNNSKAKGSSLIFKKLDFENAGTYQCTALGPFNTVSAQVQLYVFESAEFVVKPENVTALIGQPIWVHCQGSGNPTPRVSYIKNKFDLNTRNDSNFNFWPNGTFQIKQTRENDSGTYHCWLSQPSFLGETSFGVHIKAKEPEKESASMLKTVAIAVGCAGMYILLVIGLMVYCRVRRARLIKKGIITEVEDGEIVKEPLMNNEGIPLVERERSLEKWKFPREDLEGIETLGHGKMGRVFKARAKCIVPDEKRTLVAVKEFDGDGEEYKAEFDLEVEMFAQLDHDNVVRLLGVTVDSTPYYIITQYSEQGDLKQYLQNKPDLTSTERLNMSFGIACGMEYLIKLRYVHRDLAARNCVAFPDNVVKVCFLSLSEDVYSGDYYMLNDIPVPLRWLSLEAISSGHYSEKSDVWSYGVTMWEIFSGGERPYAEFDNKKVQDGVCSDLRLPMPIGCPKPVYEVMQKCWLVDTSQRPSFEELTSTIAEIELEDNE